MRNDGLAVLPRQAPPHYAHRPPQHLIPTSQWSVCCVSRDGSASGTEVAESKPGDLCRPSDGLARSWQQCLTGHQTGDDVYVMAACEARVFVGVSSYRDGKTDTGPTQPVSRGTRTVTFLPAHPLTCSTSRLRRRPRRPPTSVQHVRVRCCASFVVLLSGDPGYHPHAIRRPSRT